MYNNSEYRLISNYVQVSQKVTTIWYHEPAALIQYNSRQRKKEDIEKLVIVRTQECYNPVPIKKERVSKML